MSKEPDLEELIAQNNSGNQASLSLKDKARQHLKYFLVDGSGYAAFYGLAMIVAEPFLMDWEKVKKTRGIGLITGFLSGYAVNLLREFLGKEKKANAAAESSFNLKRLAADAIVGTVTTTPFYAPILYYANNSKFEGMEIPLVIGSVAAGVAGLAYGWFSDNWRRRWNLPGVMYK